MPQALDRMRGHGAPADAAAVQTVRTAASGAAGAPRVAIWHGTADTTVVVANLDRLVGQWRGVHALPPAAGATDRGANWEHRVWAGDDGTPLVEEWRIAGMGHGVPVDPASGIGAVGPFMLDVGLSSTLEIAKSWGLTGTAAHTAHARPEPMRNEPAPRVRRLEPVGHAADAPPPGRQATGVQATIERALRAAGLMR